MASNNFLGVFAQSPIKPLKQHIAKVCDAAALLDAFFNACFNSDWDKAGQIQQQISGLEKEADDLKSQMRLHMPKGLFMPVDRTDVLSILSKQDKIANLSKDISGRVVGRQMDIPMAIREDFVKFLNRCIDATKQANAAIAELDDLLEAGFSGREVDIAERMVVELEQIEDDTDNMQRVLRANLFAIEDQLNPVHVMFLYSVIEWVGELADIAEGVGGRLELLLARA